MQLISSYFLDYNRILCVNIKQHDTLQVTLVLVYIN